MSVNNPWTRHYQSHWRDIARRPEAPLWVRVAALAYASHRANGHAGFTPGELAGFFKTTPDDISRAIRRAKSAGWLAAQSQARCLVVPYPGIDGGLGHTRDPCAIHAGKRTT